MGVDDLGETVAEVKGLPDGIEVNDRRGRVREMEMGLFRFGKGDDQAINGREALKEHQ